MIVIDANVAVKWYLPEKGTEAAIELTTGGNRLVAPELIRLEVLSAITRGVRNNKATASEARAQCERWLNNLTDGALALVPEHSLLHDAIDLSLKVKHAFLDCMYLAVARRLEAPLLTADRPFHDRVKPFYKRISLLAGCENN
ncbi:MAG TPA: type II toxin-antitoxin system VapC family toxin [Gemmataceae bacterium]|nr:type II toxin-antitoxin system VapC family toxin [Gemmataceae bacterium]